MTTNNTPSKKLTFLITGSSSGFGLSLTRIALANGHTVIATSRNPAKSPSLVSEVEFSGGKWLKLDVNSPDTPRFIQDLESSGTQIDVLVNNAGYSVFAPIETATEEEVRAQMESMYFGPVRLIRAVLPFMRKRRFGVIANISSGASLNAYDTMGPYAGLTKVLAKEVAPFNIRTLTVVLGTFNTSFGANSVFGSVPLPDDYKGSASEQMIAYLKSGKVPVNGDKDKAMRALFEVVTGEGVGKGKEKETLLLLGSDMTARAKGVIEYLGRSLEAFEGVTNSVGIDK